MLIAFVSLLCVPLDCRALLLSRHLCSHQRWYLSLCQAPRSSLSILTLPHLAFPFHFLLCLACPVSSVSCTPFQFPASCLLGLYLSCLLLTWVCIHPCLSSTKTNKHYQAVSFHWGLPCWLSGKKKIHLPMQKMQV